MAKNRFVGIKKVSTYVFLPSYIRNKVRYVIRVSLTG